MKRGLLVFALMMLWAVPAMAQVDATCSQNAQTVEGPPGTMVTITCPAGCNQTIWGTNIYSDDSSMCTAAIHAGVLTAAGGQAQVTIAAGLEAYPASTQNGITSSEWGSWGRSFTVSALAAAVTCDQNAQTLAGEAGTHHTVMCPAGCGSATIWGTGAYSDDSSVCTAAIHAGIIQAAAGGALVVTIAPGQEAYPPSMQNGITSSQWGSWSRSFLVGPIGGACTNDCATANDGECDDGGPGALYDLCGLGTDCNDCGPR